MDTTKRVKVTLRFMTNIATVTGTNETEYFVSKDVKEAIDDIRKYFAEKSAQSLLYTILINDNIYDVALQEGYSICEGDTLTIIPVTLGG